MKTCKRCGVSEKISGKFSTKKYTCKPCTVILSREYQRTPRGLVSKIYNNQKMVVRKNGRALPTYSKEELEDWLMSQNFMELHNSWANAGYPKELSPSVDRLDNNVSYTLDNIRLVTFAENLKAQKDMNKSGEYLHTPSKAVDQYSLEGKFIQSFGSCRNAMRSVGLENHGSSNIASACYGKLKTAYGYIWRWAGEPI